MKQDKKTLFYRIFNAFLIISGLLCCFAASERAKAHIDKNVFYISPVINDNTYYFNVNKFESLNIAASYSYEGRRSNLVRFNKNEVYTDIFSTNQNYFYLNNIKFISGNSWVSGMAEEKPVVINEALAWLLYGNTDAAGAELIISGERYTVTGVVEQGDLSKDNCSVWLPLHPDYYGDKVLSAAYIKLGNYNPISAMKNMTAWLDGGRGYYITDINLYKESITLRYKILLWAISVYAILYFTRRTYLFAKAGISDINALPFAVIGVFLNIILITAAWYLVGFDIWIPKFSGTTAQQILQAVFNWSKLPPREYLTGGALELSRLNLYETIAFGVGLAGLGGFR